MSEVPTAFPWTHDNVTCTGMTLRDYFAAKAMQGIIEKGRLDRHSDLDIAKSCYAMADAMLKAREV